MQFHGSVGDMLTDPFLFPNMVNTEQPSNNYEFKSIAFTPELKTEDTDGQKRFYIEGYASIFGNKDSYGDIVEQGAFSETLSKDANRVKFCYNHDLLSGVCGKVLELREDTKGLYFKAEVIPTTIGSDLIKLIEFGAIDEMSIGYRTQEFKDENIGTADVVRRIIKASLIEISAVSRAANPQATIISNERKAEQFKSDLTILTNTEFMTIKSAVDSEYTNRVLQSIKNQ